MDEETQVCLSVPRARERARAGFGGLGQGATLGRRFLDRQGRVRLRIGPLDKGSFRQFIPAARRGAQALDARAAESLLNWKSLNLRGLRFAALPGQAVTLQVAETALSGYFARIDIDPSGRINLQDLLREPAPAEPAAARGLRPGQHRERRLLPGGQAALRL